jgi:hypothetical protein
MLALAIVLAIAIPIGAVSALQAAGSKPAAEESQALARLLRFKELPLGYRLLSFGPSPEYPAQSLACGPIDPANPQPDLDAFLRRYSPLGCYAIYYRSFHVPGTKPAALAVGSGAMVLDTIESAEAGLAVAPELLSHLIGDELPEEVEPGATIGDATRLFHWRHPGLFKVRERPSASFLIWRSGAAVAAVFATDGTVDTNDRTVLELAQLQQRRIESPIRVRASDFDSSEVALEDPALDIPVFWLGPRFAPGGGLQRLRLEDSSASTADSLAPRVSLAYIDHPRLNHAETLFLNFWSRRQWKRLEAKRRRLPAVPSCPTSKPLRIASEHLVIYKGFDVEYKGCGDNRARRAGYTAQINLDGVVATAETSMTCAVCASAGTGPYDSRAGMEAIARGLVQRQPAER